MSGLTLGGLTVDQFLGICEKAARRYIQEQMAAHPDSPQALNRREQIVLNIGIGAGVNAAVQELAKRGLIVERP